MSINCEICNDIINGAALEVKRINYVDVTGDDNEIFTFNFTVVSGLCNLCCNSIRDQNSRRIDEQETGYSWVNS